jgi:type VI secretion system lysozyme-like protein
LFERLVDADSANPARPKISSPPPVLDYFALRESVRTELNRLLNTRAPLDPAIRSRVPNTVLNYGLPDFSALEASSQGDRIKLADLIAKKISVFEPRLTRVRVVLEKNPERPTSLIGIVRAHLGFGKIQEPVSFPLMLDGKSSSAEVHPLDIDQN